jgi:GNAT superfamily N-acetyltransferase
MSRVLTVISYRDATVDEAELASDIMTASYPALAQDPVLTRYRWEHGRKEYSYGRYLAERDGTPIAFLGWMHGPWARLPDRHCEVEVWLERSALDRGLLQEMFLWIGDRAQAEGSQLLLSYCGEDEPEMLEALSASGYQRERLERVWELDLVKNGTRLRAEAERIRRDVADSGIELTTVARWVDPDRVKKMYELDSITRQHIPTSLPILAEALEDFVRRSQAPDRREDRTWVAVDHGRAVAMSYMKFPPVRGTVWTGYTCTHPEYRGRGLARAIKLQSLAQAAELGVELVCTDNDSENSPILHINQTLGYRPRPGFVEHHKRVTRKNDA